MTIERSCQLSRGVKQWWTQALTKKGLNAKLLSLERLWYKKEQFNCKGAKGNYQNFEGAKTVNIIVNAICTQKFGPAMAPARTLPSTISVKANGIVSPRRYHRGQVLKFLLGSMKFRWHKTYHIVIYNTNASFGPHNAVDWRTSKKNQFL